MCSRLKLYYDLDWFILTNLRGAIVILIMYATWFDL